MKNISCFGVFFFSLTAAQIEEAGDCASCHEDIYKQWKESMHFKSTAEQDELYAGEVRILTYQLPENVKKAYISLTFRLAPLFILNKLKIDDPYLKSAHLISEHQLVIKE